MEKQNLEKDITNKRKIDIVAEEMFDGDVEKTLNYLLDNDQCIEQYIDELTKAEANLVLDWVDKNIIETKFGGKEKFQRNIINEMRLKSSLETIKMSEEQVRITEKNPFISLILKHIAILISGIVVVLVAEGVFNEHQILSILPFFIGFEALNLSGGIFKCIKFKKAKKIIAETDKNKICIDENNT